MQCPLDIFVNTPKVRCCTPQLHCAILTPYLNHGLHRCSLTCSNSQTPGPAHRHCNPGRPCHNSRGPVPHIHRHRKGVGVAATSRATAKFFRAAAAGAVGAAVRPRAASRLCCSCSQKQGSVLLQWRYCCWWRWWWEWQEIKCKLQQHGQGDGVGGKCAEALHTAPGAALQRPVVA